MNDHIELNLFDAITSNSYCINASREEYGQLINNNGKLLI